MNKRCYRIVFNRVRQEQLVVSRLARSQGGDATQVPAGSGCVKAPGFVGAAGQRGGVSAGAGV